MSGKSSPIGTMHRKERMLEALIAHHGIVTRAAKATGITPQTHYNWYKEDEEYQSEVEMLKYECYEEFKDIVMEAVLKKINEGNTSIIAMCYKSLFKTKPEQMEMKTPFKQRLKVGINYVPRPVRNQANDPIFKGSNEEI